MAQVTFVHGTIPGALCGSKRGILVIPNKPGWVCDDVIAIILLHESVDGRSIKAARACACLEVKNES